TGENVADRAVRGGLSAVVVESELVGGECSYWACMPSKALLRPVGVVGEASAVRGVTGARLEPAEVLARRDGFTHDWKDDGQVEWLNGARISLVRGRARLVGERLVSVGDATLTARHAVVVATGTNALVPAVLADVRPWTSREATSAKAAPSRLAIVGGGVVGCEMAAAWSALGSRVTLVSRGPLLDRVPAFAGELVAAGLRDAGVDVRTGVNVSAATRADGPVTLTLDDGTSVEADEVLAAVGRTPKTADIGLSAVGLKDGSWLSVDDTMRVTDVAGGWLYACGDVNHLALLTHMGKYQARVCGDAIAARATGRDPAVLDIASRTRVPQVVFTLPEVAAIGLTAEQAAAAGLRVRVVEYEIGDVAGAKLFADGYQGRAQMVVDEDRRVIVGLTLAGPGVGEMIHAATIAVVGEVPLDLLWHAVPAYPTMSEVWLRLLETYGL
ncbi:MAG: pyridine nucleotide-disulfide oxidoreductase dimerization subunit, partial [Actinomycetia bacterium]|nr:pyridine nucleotide-disulfide oxidoreductase dimerization subunit [Actinomycetes bacterium]